MADTKKNNWQKLKSIFSGKEDIGENNFVQNRNSSFAVSVPTNDYLTGSGGTYRTLFGSSYTGEKNLGEIGPLKDYRMEYDMLRIRSWQSFVESEVTQTVFGRLTRWVIGKGLKLQCEPQRTVLESESVTFNVQDFCKQTEAYFSVWSEDKDVDYSGNVNLGKLSSRAYRNSKIGGDVLVLLRYEDDNITIQLIDGAHIQSPVYGTEGWPNVLENGNRIMYGVEVDEKRNIVAYHIRSWENPNTIFKTTRVPARDPQTGLVTAFLVYGLEYRLDNIRGLPLISGVLETLKKMERYKEATVGSAEERQKIAYSIEHSVNSTGENPLIRNMAKAFDAEAPLNDNLPVDYDGVKLANTVAATTNKQTINMPIGAQLKILESKNELYFKDFYTVNIDSVCSTLNIPPDVAKSMYNSNFSASRAALKDWEHTLHTERKDFKDQFYQHVYNFWLHIMILKNKVQAPGYLAAFYGKNKYIIGAYRMCRFVGTPVPHIDPLKEVNAERAKLGSLADTIPLTTVEAATEHLNEGESENNLEQFSIEYNKAKDLGLIQEQENTQEDNSENNTEEN